MIDAYIVRDPQGRVLAVSVEGYMDALRIAENGGWLPRRAIQELGHQFAVSKRGSSNGYTLKHEQVAL
jgi:hypothetical protein